MYTMEDFQRQYAKDHFPRLTREEQAEVLQKLPPEEKAELLLFLPPEERLAGLSEEQIRQHLDRMSASHPAASRKSRRKR